jgi:3-deoxy-manno-octulosonate cytidylyltransferase (CMP-KDO synthetase)
MKTAVVIPARYASTRLPGKPLLRETGKYLIQYVYERACQAQGVDQVIVATDDPRIAAAVRGSKRRQKSRLALARADPGAVG